MKPQYCYHELRLNNDGPVHLCVGVCVCVCVAINAKLRATLNAKNYHQMHRRTDAWFRLEMLRIVKERTNCTILRQCAHLLQFWVLPSPSSQYCGKKYDINTWKDVFSTRFCLSGIKKNLICMPFSLKNHYFGAWFWWDKQAAKWAYSRDLICNW